MAEVLNRAYFESLLVIDKNRIDDEVVQQPDHYWRVAREAAFASSRAAEAKHDLKVVDANLNAEIPSALETKGIKTTVQNVTAAITAHPDHIEASQALIEADREAGLWGALRESFQQRSWAVKDAVSLTVSGYVSNSSAGGAQRASTDARADAGKKAMAAVRKPLTRKPAKKATKQRTRTKVT